MKAYRRDYIGLVELTARVFSYTLSFNKQVRCLVANLDQCKRVEDESSHWSDVSNLSLTSLTYSEGLG